MNSLARWTVVHIALHRMLFTAEYDTGTAIRKINGIYRRTRLSKL